MQMRAKAVVFGVDKLGCSAPRLVKAVGQSCHANTDSLIVAAKHLAAVHALCAESRELVSALQFHSIEDAKPRRGWENAGERRTGQGWRLHLEA